MGWKGDSGNRRNGPCHNPWRHGRTPGGSSGGTAAAAVAGYGPLHQGSDGAGSVRIPASLLRRRRPEADLRADPAVPAERRRDGLAHRPHHAHGRRHRADARRHGGPGRARSHVGRSALPLLPRRAGRTARAAPGRLQPRPRLRRRRAGRRRARRRRGRRAARARAPRRRGRARARRPVVDRGDDLGHGHGGAARRSLRRGARPARPRPRRRDRVGAEALRRRAGPRVPGARRLGRPAAARARRLRRAGLPDAALRRVRAPATTIRARSPAAR